CARCECLAEAELVEDLHRPRLDSERSGFIGAVESLVDDPERNAVAVELTGHHQPGRTRAHDQHVDVLHDRSSCIARARTRSSDGFRHSRVSCCRPRSEPEPAGTTGFSAVRVGPRVAFGPRAGGKTMKKKFPRMEVIEKQIAVVAEVDPEAIPEEDLAKIQGGSLASTAANVTRQLYIMYGVPRP